MIPDNFYDYAILNRTLLEVHKPYLVLGEMIRVAAEGIISFTNFANWKHRLRLNMHGRMPVSRELPYNWYDKSNIHFLTLKDFMAFCREKGIEIQKITCIPDGIVSRILNFLGLKNLGTDRAIALIKKIISKFGSFRKIEKSEQNRKSALSPLSPKGGTSMEWREGSFDIKYKISITPY